MAIFGTTQKPTMPKVGKFHSGPNPGVKMGGGKKGGSAKSYPSGKKSK
jgi:hypothetical protein